MKSVLSLLLMLLMFSVFANDNGYTSEEVIVLPTSDTRKDDKGTWDRLIGRWYGNQPTKSGGRLEWTVTHEPNGAFKNEARYIDQNGNAWEVDNFGLWGVSGDIIVITILGEDFRGKIELIDRNYWDTRDALKVIELTDNKIVYQSVAFGNKYTVIKVAEDFELSER